MIDSLLNARIAMMGIGTVATALAVQFVLRPAILDSFRQRIFAIRRDAFLFVANGVIRRDDPEYIATQAYLNRLLRYAERLMFLRLVAGMVVIEMHADRMKEFPFSIPKSPDAEVSQLLHRIRQRATERVFWHVIETSPLAWLALAIFLPVGIAKKVKRSDGVKRSLVNTMGRLVPQELVERDVTIMAASEEACLSPAA